MSDFPPPSTCYCLHFCPYVAGVGILTSLELWSWVEVNFRGIAPSLPTKVCIVKAIVFLVVMYRCESWTIKNAECQRTAVSNCGAGKDFESPLDCKEIKPFNTKGNQAWKFIGRTDVEAEAPILWPPDTMTWLTGKDPDAGKDWRQKEKWDAEDVMVRQHHWVNGHEFEQTLGDSEGQESLACCSSCSHKKSDTN